MGSVEPTQEPAELIGHRMTPAEVTAELNPSHRHRMLVVLSFPLLFLLAVPFWWYSTSIERLPLPTSRIAALETSARIDTRTSILVTADDNAFPEPPPGKPRYSTNAVLSSLSREVVKGVTSTLNQKAPEERGKRMWDLVTDPKGSVPSLRIHLKQSDRTNASFPLRPYIQDPETGLMTSGLPAGTCVIPVHPSQMGDRMLNKHYQIAMINSLNALFPNLVEPPDIPLRALKYAPNVTLSFVLLNEDASEGSYVRSWDIEGALQDHFIPHLEPLRQIFNFTIESQLLYHAPLSFEPTFGPVPVDRFDNITPSIEAAAQGDEDAEDIAKELIDRQREQAWLVGEEETKIFVNSERWSLDSGSTNNPVLRFLFFVPASKHRPMRLAFPDSAQSILLPQYGSVGILDPPPSIRDADAYHLSTDVLATPFHLFIQHLYSLLALPLNPPYINPSPSASPLIPPNPFIQPISPWQVEQIMRTRTKENSEEARKTLAGIVRLVSKIKEMKVGAGVRNKVLGAVERLEKMDVTTDSLEAFILSRDAVGLANEAFFDPSMMGLLYFPDEHKFAIYTPLFAPVAVPMIVGLTKEYLAWKKRRTPKLRSKTYSSGDDKIESDVKLDVASSTGHIPPYSTASVSKSIKVESTQPPSERVLRKRNPQMNS